MATLWLDTALGDKDQRDAHPMAGRKGLDRYIHEPILKRSFDFLLSAAGLLFSLPVWGLIAACIWLEDGRPIFFRQDRIGRNGKNFRVLKFRSMVKDPSRVEIQTTRSDPRITFVGRMLRKTALDELPQLWNILIGDMSFVGPRSQPEMERIKKGDIEEEVYIRKVPGFELRQLVRPGLTGITQIYAPREVPHRQKFKYDLIYVRRVLNNGRLHSMDPTLAHGRGVWAKIKSKGLACIGDIRMFFFDLNLILRSVWITVRGKWEI